MNRKIRYSLIALGFTVFIICAPLILLYVSGLSYNFQTRSFTRTGLIAVRIDPGSAAVYLNNKLAKKSDGDLRFLPPGEYDVRVQKDGYRSWQKRLLVNQNEVTWANSAPNKLFLFKQDTRPEILASSVVDFAISGPDLLYLAADMLSLTSASNNASVQNFPLPAPVDTITAPPRGNLVLLTGNATSTRPTLLVFNIAEKKFFDISSLFNDSPSLQYSDNGDLYALASSTVYKIDSATPALFPIAQNVKTFSVNFGNLYYISQKNNGAVFLSIPLSGNEPQQQLATNLPPFSSGQIFISLRKHIALRLNNSLYAVGAHLEKITDGITQSSFDSGSGLLVLMHDGELGTYDFYNRSITFITRTSRTITSPVVNPAINYAVFFKDKDVQALELDLRDHQNGYLFYTAENPKKIYLSPDGARLIIQDGGKLIQQTLH